MENVADETSEEKPLAINIPEEAKPKPLHLVWLAVTMVAHFVCALFTGFVIYTAQPGSTLFSWHPTLMVLSFAFFMVEAILFFSPESSLIVKYTRKAKVKSHWVFMLLGIISALLGFIAIYANKNRKGVPHFTSWHGKVGLGTLIYAVLQCCAGTVLLYPHVLPKSLKLGQMKAYHATSGLFLTTLSNISLALGMWSGWFTTNVTGTSWYACFACPMVIALVVMKQVSEAYLPNPSGPRAAYYRATRR